MEAYTVLDEIRIGGGGCSAKVYIFYISPFPSTRTKMNKPGRLVYILHSKLAPGASFV